MTTRRVLASTAVMAVMAVLLAGCSMHRRTSDRGAATTAHAADAVPSTAAKPSNAAAPVDLVIADVAASPAADATIDLEAAPHTATRAVLGGLPTWARVPAGLLDDLDAAEAATVAQLRAGVPHAPVVTAAYRPDRRGATTDGGPTPHITLLAWHPAAVLPAQVAGSAPTSVGTAAAIGSVGTAVIADPVPAGTPTTEITGSQTRGDATGTGQTTVDMGVTTGSSADGTRTAGMDVTVTGTAGGTTASVGTSSKATLDPCPTAEGRVHIDFTFSSHASLQQGAGAAQSHTTKVTGTADVSVSDDAVISNIELNADVEVTNTSAGAAGPSATVAYQASAVGPSAGYTGDGRITKESSLADRATTEPQLQQGMRDAVDFVNLAAVIAQQHWRGGHCVTIVAEAPSTVAPKAATHINVQVKHKPDGVDLEVPVDVKLDGGDTIDPQHLDRAPGTLTHVAPAEQEKTSTITLTSTSRRGIGTKTVTIKTSHGWDLRGTAGPESVEGTICDKNAPFTVYATGGADMTATFSPNSENGGSITWSGRVTDAPLGTRGSGQYTVVFNDDGTGSISFSVFGVVDLVGREGGDSFTLPLIPSTSCT